MQLVVPTIQTPLDELSVSWCGSSLMQLSETFRIVQCDWTFQYPGADRASCNGEFKDAEGNVALPFSILVRIEPHATAHIRVKRKLHIGNFQYPGADRASCNLTNPRCTSGPHCVFQYPGADRASCNNMRALLDQLSVTLSVSWCGSSLMQRLVAMPLTFA